MIGFKQSPVLLQDINRSFRFGFFFDSIYRVLDTKNLSDLTNIDKKILQEGKKFLMNVQKGASIVESGIFGSSAVEEISAYRRSLYVFSLIEIDIKSVDQFKGYINNLIDLITKIEKQKKLSPHELNNLKNFFQKLNIESYKESSSILESFDQNRSPITWPTI